MITTTRAEPLLRLEALSKSYNQGRWWKKQLTISALIGINLVLERGKTLAVVGRSGSGKTTLARCVAMVDQPSSGEIWFGGRPVSSLSRSERAQLRPEVQLLFQDSAAALPPRFSAAQVIEEPLLIQRHFSATERSGLVLDLMARVGLSPTRADRLPHEFSGGQRQRLAIARALALSPKLLVLDEPFVGLDLSVRGQIINLLLDLQKDLSLTYLCISHDFDLVRYFADTVVVLDQGRLMSEGNARDFQRGPLHSDLIGRPTSEDVCFRTSISYLQ